MWLLIDDERDLGYDVIARNSAVAKELLPLKCWTMLGFDHDLGDQSVSPDNGYQVMMWAAERGYLSIHIQLVTSNPVGRKNMTALLHDLGYESKDGVNFRVDKVPEPLNPDLLK